MAVSSGVAGLNFNVKDFIVFCTHVFAWKGENASPYWQLYTTLDPKTSMIFTISQLLTVYSSSIIIQRSPGRGLSPLTERGSRSVIRPGSFPEFITNRPVSTWQHNFIRKCQLHMITVSFWLRHLIFTYLAVPVRQVDALYYVFGSFSAAKGGNPFVHSVSSNNVAGL